MPGRLLARGSQHVRSLGGRACPVSCAAAPCVPHGRRVSDGRTRVLTPGLAWLAWPVDGPHTQQLPSTVAGTHPQADRHSRTRTGVRVRLCDAQQPSIRSWQIRTCRQVQARRAGHKLVTAGFRRQGSRRGTPAWVERDYAGAKGSLGTCQASGRRERPAGQPKRTLAGNILYARPSKSALRSGFLWWAPFAGWPLEPSPWAGLRNRSGGGGGPRLGAGRMGFSEIERDFVGHDP